MYSQSFADLPNEFPAERESISRLGRIAKSTRHREMTLSHLILQVSPQSIESLVLILERLVSQRTVRRVYRIESPRTRGKIDDFESFRDVPETIFDWHSGEELVVTPRDLRVYYKFA